MLFIRRKLVSKVSEFFVVNNTENQKHTIRLIQVFKLAKKKTCMI